MKRNSLISTLGLLANTLDALILKWLAPHDINIDLSEEEPHLYL